MGVSANWMAFCFPAKKSFAINTQPHISHYVDINSHFPHPTAAQYLKSLSMAHGKSNKRRARTRTNSVASMVSAAQKVQRFLKFRNNAGRNLSPNHCEGADQIRARTKSIVLDLDSNNFKQVITEIDRDVVVEFYAEKVRVAMDAS